MRRAHALNLAAFLVGVGLMALLCAGIGWAQVGGFLRAVGWGGAWLVLIFAGAHLVESASLWIAIGRQCSLGRVLWAHLAGSTVNGLTPLGEAGEIVKWNLLRADADGESVAAGVLAWNAFFRLTKYTVIFAAPLTVALVGGGAFTGKTLLLVEAAAALSFVPSILVFVLLWRGSAEMVVRLIQRVPIWRSREPERLIEKARRTDRGVRHFARSRRADAWVALSLLLIARLLSALEVNVVLHLLGFGIDFPTALFLYGGTVVVNTYLSLSPVQIGVSEAGQYVFFGLVGLSPALGFSQGLVLRIRMLLFHFLGLAYLGCVALRGRAGRKRPSNLRMTGSTGGGIA